MSASIPSGLARILVVDDDRDTRIVMQRLLQTAGYEVITADSCAAALEVAQRQRIDLLIADIGLPERDGIELMTQLHAMYPMPAIAISGYGMPADKLRGTSAGFAEYLVKPIDFNTLKSAVYQVLNLHRRSIEDKDAGALDDDTCELEQTA